MVIHRIEVVKKGKDPEVQKLSRLMAEDGLVSKGLSIIKVYFIKTDLAKKEVEALATELFADSVEENLSFGRTQPQGMRSLEVWFNPGVTDPESNWIKTHMDRRKIPVKDIKRATRFIFPASVSRAKLVRFAERHLFNPLIQHLAIRGEDPFPRHTGARFKIEYIELNDLSDDELLELSVKRDWHFNLEEMHAIRNHFKKEKRQPTLTEIETIAQTWSEHCVHKTFNAVFELQGEKFNNLLKDTIMNPSKELQRPWCLSLFKDNAGVIEFNKNQALAFKVETHNHPSAIEPYGGAATGTGGVIRDALGTGLGADPIINTDVFCFGPPGYPSRKLPKGTLPPRRIMEGVVQGVRDYGNRMGIPTASGAIYFDELYIANPLVYCGTLGIMPRDKVDKKVSEGDLIVVAGARTGRDGIHGVTFASTALAKSSSVKHGSAVQIGNPIEEKLLRDLVLAARDSNLISAITDCGGGGLSSAVGEMTEKQGCRIELEKIPLKYAGLTHHEIWISESQERMLFFINPERIDSFLKLAEDIGVEAAVIGEVTNDKVLRLRFKETQVAALDMKFLHKGLPPRKFHISKPNKKTSRETEVIPPRDMGQALLRLLGQLNVTSKEWVIRQYDHEVKGGTILKPLGGIGQNAPMDAAVIQPNLNSLEAIAISAGLAPRYAMLDAYASAAAAIDEAIRNLIVVGGRFDRIALLDNFCAGDTSDNSILYQLLQSCKACKSAIETYRTPFISGKDSLNNFYISEKGEKINIPTTLLISAVTLVRDVSKIVTSDFKKPGSRIYIVGQTKMEMGGSEYLRMHKKMGANPPRVDMKTAKKNYRLIEKAIREDLVLSAHDLSDGGLGVAMAEMCLGGEIGARIYVDAIPTDGNFTRTDYLLFSETQSRILLEVDEKKAKRFEELMEGTVFASIGETVKGQRLLFYEDGKRPIATASIDEIRTSWTQGLSRFLD